MSMSVKNARIKFDSWQEPQELQQQRLSSFLGQGGQARHRIHPGRRDSADATKIDVALYQLPFSRFHNHEDTAVP
jgi:hypothetical protein